MSPEDRDPPDPPDRHDPPGPPGPSGAPEPPPATSPVPAPPSGGSQTDHQPQARAEGGHGPVDQRELARLRAEIARQDASRGTLTRRPALTTMAALAIGAVFGALATLTWQAAPSARAVSGAVAAIDDTASAIALDGPEDLVDRGFGVVGVLWRDVTAPVGQQGWQRTLSPAGHPTCLTPDDEGREVRIGLVTDPGGTDRPRSEVIAWLECGPRLASGGGS